MALYDRGNFSWEIGYYPILQHEAIFKITRLIIESIGFKKSKLSFAGGAGVVNWNDPKPKVGAEIALAAKTVSDKVSNLNQLEDVNPGSSPCSKLDILSWLTRVFHTGTEFLKLKDQLITFSRIASFCKRLGFERKHAFYMRLASKCIQALEGGKPKSSSVAVTCLLKSFEVHRGINAT